MGAMADTDAKNVLISDTVFTEYKGAFTEQPRYWMNEKGKVEVMARKRTMGIYMDTFCYDSDIELRRDNTQQHGFCF